MDTEISRKKIEATREGWLWATSEGFVAMPKCPKTVSTENVGMKS